MFALVRSSPPTPARRSGLRKVAATMALALLCLAPLGAEAQTVPPGTLILTPIPPPLSAVAVPRPSLSGIVNTGQDAALVRLGKALFWDQQVGGDGVMACASCHYHAGVDHRRKNQVNPGTNTTFDTAPAKGMAQTPDMFPFGWATVKPLSDDVMGSQGTLSGDFKEVTPNSPVDTTTTVGIIGHRQVTGRNSPSNINAVFNFRNFWDGRAAESFNGVTPFGAMDQNAKLIIDTNGTSAGGFSTQKINLPFASLASQAVGPPNNDVEMSFRGRDWADLGFKLLSRKPLALQTVAAGTSGDSILGSVAVAIGNPPRGLTYATYADMMAGIFNSRYTTASFRLCFSATGYVVKNPLINCAVGRTAGYSIAEANFSLFFGLALQAYQATLVSSNTPFDTWASTGSQTHTGTGLTDAQFRGMLTFYGPRAQCGVCHFGPEFTSASVSFLNLLQAGGAVDGGLFPVNNLNIGVFDPTILRTSPQPAPTTGTLRANTRCSALVNGVTVAAPCTYATAGAADGITTYLQGTTASVLGPDKRFVGPYERMIMAYRKDSGNNIVPINLFNVFNQPSATNPLSATNLPPPVTLPVGANGDFAAAFGTTLGTAPVNQTTQSPFALYDLGFYNIGPRPTSDDKAVGGTMPPNILGTAPFPPTTTDPVTGQAVSRVPLSLTRRMKANQASASKMATEDRDYWNPASSFSAFPFNTCVVQENQVINECVLAGAPAACTTPGAIINPIPGVAPFPANADLVNPQACNFFDRNGTAVLDPLTLQPMVGGRLLNGADYQYSTAGTSVPGTATKSPDLTCSGTTVYGPTVYGPTGPTGVTPVNSQCPEERDAVDGAFKTPGLRNVEFTGPYFHNGSAKTLQEVVEFYASGGHHQNLELSPEILAIPANILTPGEKSDLVEFLKALTDERVARQQAPFDHPSLCLPESNAAGYDEYRLLPATGRNGVLTRLETFEAMLYTTDRRPNCQPY